MLSTVLHHGLTDMSQTHTDVHSLASLRMCYVGHMGGHSSLGLSKPKKAKEQKGKKGKRTETIVLLGN